MEAEEFIDLQRIEVSEVGKEVLRKEEGEMVEDHVEKKDDQLPLESSVSNGADLEKHLSENGPESALEPVALESKVEVDLFAVGTKRRRISYSSQQPSVRVVYSLLTRESKNKLGELMQQWSDWHSRNASTRKDSTEESLESGEETYFPALCVGLEKSSTVTFWMDNQARLDGKIGNSSEIESVPMYDRGFTKGSSSGEGLASLERCAESPEHDSRCFNCGSYNHSLKECPKPRDNVAVNNARKKHNSKRKTPLGPRLPTRYYQNSPGGKFDGIKPGVIGSETRQCLGIGEFDPPPWLNRMREIGYPPGYLGTEDEAEPSGITIYTDEKSEEACEDGEILETDNSISQEGKKMMIDFPGINAPIPENADSRCWAASPKQTHGPASGRDWSNPRSSHSEGRQFFDRRSTEDYTDDAPPGTSGHYSSHMQSPGVFSPSYGSESESSRLHNSIPRSPSLTRSYSERRRSSLAYDSSHSRNHGSYNDPSHSPHVPSYYNHGTPSYSSPRSSSWQSPRSPARSDPWGLDDRHRQRGTHDSSRWKDHYDYQHHHRR
ncbi:Zinc finger CCHC domain-containing protein 8 [Nymphaea thermarum]|nr:Zinc finger CCHC domain-containing protein 8 [Nymphaea thermarum]